MIKILKGKPCLKWDFNIGKQNNNVKTWEIEGLKTFFVILGCCGSE
jgi:hypothetical protein